MSRSQACTVQLILGDRVIEEYQCNSLAEASRERNRLYKDRRFHEGDTIRVLSVDGERCFADMSC